MAKRRKKTAANDRSDRPAPKPAAPAEPPPSRSLLAEFARRPLLLLAWISLAVTVFGVAALIRFQNDLEMGAIREPTGPMIWAAITLTLFASYWRQTRREAPRDDS